MTTALPQAAAILDTWIDNGDLASLVDSRLDDLRYPGLDYRNEPRETWYTRELTENGLAAANAKLEQYAVGLRNNAAAILSTAKGMLALCKADPETRRGDKYVSVVGARSLKLPGYRPESPLAQAIVIFNPEVPGCGCSQPKGSYVFGPHGTLGLKAVVLYTDPRSPEHSSLNLILPSRRKDASDATYAVAEFDLKGLVQTHEVAPHLYNDGPLRVDLGILSREQAWSAMFSSGGGNDFVFGPGCMDYITSNLADLGNYFEATAEQLSGTHTH